MPRKLHGLYWREWDTQKTREKLWLRVSHDTKKVTNVFLENCDIGISKKNLFEKLWSKVLKTYPTAKKSNIFWEDNSFLDEHERVD